MYPTQPCSSPSSNASMRESSSISSNQGSTPKVDISSEKARKKAAKEMIGKFKREMEEVLVAHIYQKISGTVFEKGEPEEGATTASLASASASQRDERAGNEPHLEGAAKIKANQIFGLAKVMIGKLKLEQMYPKLPLREALLSLILDSPSSKASEVMQVAQKAFDPLCAVDPEKIETIDNFKSVNFLLNQRALFPFTVEEILKASELETLQKNSPDAAASIEILLKLCGPLRALTNEIGSIGDRFSARIEQNAKETVEHFFNRNQQSAPVIAGRNARFIRCPKQVKVEGDEEMRLLKHRLHSLKPQLLKKIDLFEQNLKKVLMTSKPHQEMLVKLLTCTSDQIADVALSLSIQIQLKCGRVKIAQSVLKVMQSVHEDAKTDPSLSKLLSIKSGGPSSNGFEIKTKMGLKLSQKDMENAFTADQLLLEDIEESLPPFCNSFSTLFIGIGDHLQSLCQQGAIPEPIHKETLWLEVIDFAQESTTERPKRERRHALPQAIKVKSDKTSAKAPSQHSAQQAVLQPSPLLEETFFTRSDAIYKSLTNGFKAYPDFQSLMQGPLRYEARDAFGNFKHHLFQTFMGMHMLQQTLDKGKVNPLIALIPALVMDITVCLEQIASMSYLKKFGILPLSHSLTENLEATGRFQGLSEEVKGNLFDLNKANIWARYPISSQRNFIKGATPRGLFLIKRAYELLTGDPSLGHQNIEVLVHGVEALFTSSIASMCSLLKIEGGDLSFCRLPEKKLTLEPMAYDSRIASCLSKLKDRLDTDCLKDCYYHLVRLNQAKALSWAFPEQHLQAWHYRMALNLSLIFELALMQIAKGRGAGLIFSHDFEDFYPHLPRVPQKEILNRFCLGKALHYPHDAEVPSVVQAMLALEKSGKGFRHAPPGFTTANAKGASQFGKLMEEVYEEGLVAFQNLLGLLDAPPE